MEGRWQVKDVRHSERWQPAVWSTKIKIEAQIFVN